MKINIDDINYLTSHEEFNPPHLKNSYTTNFLKVLKKWVNIILRGILSIPYFFYNYYAKLNSNTYLFISFTDNNKRALKPIQDKLPDSISYDLQYPLPLRRTWFYAMLYSPFVAYKYFKANGYLKKAYASEFIAYCQCYGFYHEAQNILKRIKPNMLILANDHTYPQRAFFRAAQKLNIKTIYVQHASVSEYFPPLEFDYAFLDGQESYEKYIFNDKKCNSIIFLSGNPRFDIINSKSNIKDCNNLFFKCGIAINAIDEIEKIKELIFNLKNNFDNIEITLRPHPSMETSFWKIFSKEHDLNFSDSKKENPFDFINKNDLFIAGDSSFHLDVALTGKKSYHYNFSKNKKRIDVYGYLKNGLIEEINSFSEKEINIINSNHQFINQEVISYYVSNYNTPYWGKSAELIAKTLIQLGKSEIPDFWIRKEENIYKLNKINIE